MRGREEEKTSLDESSPSSLTHDSNKEVAKEESANPDPEEDVGAGEGLTGDLHQVRVDLKPLVKSEQLEQRQQSSRQ